MSKLDIQIVGVGGQGTLTMARILAAAAVRSGLHVQSGETHGMAQRGGSVEVTVRVGEVVWGPIIPEGQADVLIGFDLLEAVRASAKLGERSTVVVNTRPVPLSGGVSYPPQRELLALLEQASANLVSLDAASLAADAGSEQTLNMVLLGLFSATVDLPFDTGLIVEAIRTETPAALHEVNLRAFELGRCATAMTKVTRGAEDRRRPAGRDR